MAKCKFCKKPDALFRPTGLARYCNFDCMIGHANGITKKASSERQKAERKANKNKLALLNQTVKHWRPKAQIAFNLFIRNRDLLEPCISCGCSWKAFSKNNYITGSPWDCGHYLSTGSAAELRFSEDNAHKQCTTCNRQLSGNAVRYRQRLITKIGQHRVDLLEGPHVLPKWKWFDYEAVYNWYKNQNNITRRES